MSVDLVHSPHLGRQIRSGDAVALGRPTNDLLLDALVRGDQPEADRLLAYATVEAERVFFIFTTWIRAMLAYGREQVPDFEARLAGMEARIGEPPRLTLGDDVGVAERDAAARAVATGDAAAARVALDALRDVRITVHDNQADWSWGLLTLLREALGEAAMGEAMRATMEPWLRDRYAALGAMSPREIFELTIEGMRGHYVGPGRTGDVIVRDEPDRWVMEFDPCGTGGRMRRGDPARGQVPRTEPPYDFSMVQEAYDWTWGERDVCLYCAHCAVVNEILPIEQHGTPMRVTDYPRQPGDRCRWTVYKDPSFVPLDAFTRVGKSPPIRCPAVGVSGGASEAAEGREAAIDEQVRRGHAREVGAHQA